MKTIKCPFHPECQFPKGVMKTPSEAMLMQFYCLGHYEDCHILQRKLADLPGPTEVRPDEPLKKGPDKQLPGFSSKRREDLQWRPYE
jgi:hypothetical protein